MYVYIYIYIYTYIYIYMQSWKKYAVPVITTLSLWQLMHLSTWCSSAQVHELPQSHCGDNWEGTLLLWLYIYYAHLAFVRFEHFNTAITATSLGSSSKTVNHCLHFLYALSNCCQHQKLFHYFQLYYYLNAMHLL